MFTLKECLDIKKMLAWWRGRTARADSRNSPSGGVARLRVKSVQDDYITCRSWDGTTEGTIDILVAKPYLLRRTPYDGKTIAGLSYSYSGGTARTVTKAGNSKNQTIIGAYQGVSGTYGGDEIWADMVGSGVANAPLMDQNRDGRYWADL